jgi:hypothetical protein
MRLDSRQSLFFQSCDSRPIGFPLSANIPAVLPTVAVGYTGPVLRLGSTPHRGGISGLLDFCTQTVFIVGFLLTQRISAFRKWGNSTT